MEHYRNEILKVLRISSSFAKKKDKLVSCSDIACKNCDFNGLHCGKDRMLWLMEEYKEPIVLTLKEKHLLECIGFGFIARDKASGNDIGNLYWYGEDPKLFEESWDKPDIDTYIVPLENKLFDFITFEDGKAWSVEELRKLEVKDE
jgi:hypothetical protein